MANTFVLIQAQNLTSTATSITFSSIPATYTDLLIKSSIRNSGSDPINGRLTINGTSSGYSETLLYGSGSSSAAAQASSGTFINWTALGNSGSSLSNTFSNGEIYIPNYLVAQNKPILSYSADENNSSAANLYFDAPLWSNTSAITSLTLTASLGSFAINSSFYLYGILKS
jgi:hypothetical protein